ncbi:hypothetical protein A0J61_06822 [Choanephora cucurbitarum]|uniref:Uncharacterized protein n=1 Tax=Choanephora cucurbitarum TaxID=101091 RepID=A0A1C7N7K4_9FUNG|nr:hypothetical protein A0J61_06822 [Choanephora cucurbitarum]
MLLLHNIISQVLVLTDFVRPYQILISNRSNPVKWSLILTKQSLVEIQQKTEIELLQAIRKFRGQEG